MLLNSYKKSFYILGVLALGWLALVAQPAVASQSYATAGIYKAALSPSDSYYGNQW